ncbi:UNVERIFIED_ORG: integral membrane protein [Arthrobacter sp. UYCu721]
MDFLRVFRVLAVAEAVSWLLLIPATIVKYTTGEAGGVQVLGPVHGALFVAYVLLALFLWRKNEWTGRALAIVLVDSVLPTGGFWVARRSDLDAPKVAVPTP